MEREDWARAMFLDLAPEYKSVLTDLALKQKYMLTKNPIAEQEADWLEIAGEATEK
jgi:hypothetical protein